MRQTIDYDRIARDYAQHRRVHPRLLFYLVEAARDAGGVLEVGCGTGNYVIAIRSLTGSRCWGIDPSEKMLSRARERQADVRFGQGRAERLAFPAASFDLVFSVDVIHHLDSLQQYVEQVHRVLTPGGRICTATDSEWVIRHRQPLSTYFPETVKPELERYPRIHTLRALMEQAGFAEIDEQDVEHARLLTDARPYRDKAYSALHLISESAFQEGIRRMERDLLDGPIPVISRYTMLWGRK